MLSYKKITTHTGMKTKKSTLTLNQLSKSLQFWEDMNLFSEMNFKDFLRNGDSSKNKILSPLIGSELDHSFSLAREIKDYHLLRKQIEKGEDFDPMQFLPRTPKDYRESNLEKDELFELLGAQTVLSLPIFIKNWLKGKKVCEVSNPKKIEIIDPTIENYLSYLPYDNFILSLGQPMASRERLQDNKLGSFLYFSNIFISIDRNIIKTLAIPDDIEKFLFNPEQKKAIAEIINLPKKTKKDKYDKQLKNVFDLTLGWQKEVYNFANSRINLETGEFLLAKNLSWEKSSLLSMVNFNQDIAEDAYDGLIKFAKSEWNISILSFLLNGIGKLIANYEAPESINFIGLNDENEVSEPAEVLPSVIEEIIVPEDHQWYEVSVGNVTYITQSKLKNKGFTIHTGREMPPHLRRKHVRHYRNERGEITKTVFVKQSTIRKDKLNQGTPIHGSVSALK